MPLRSHHRNRRPRSLWLGHDATGLAAALCAGLLCSCTATGSNAVSPWSPPADQMSATRPAAEGVARMSSPLATGVQHDVSLPWNGAGITPVDYQAPVGSAKPVNYADATFSPADPRMPLEDALHQVPVCAPGCAPGGDVIHAGAGILTPRPDEYLCDGGDRTPPVHYGRRDRRGLDTEDTVAEWATPEGRHVSPSNKVCVYAPRFGEVRSITGAADGVGVEQLIAANDVRRGAGLDSRLVPGSEVQKTRLEDVRMRSRVSGVETDAALAGVEQAAAAVLGVNDTPAFVDTAFLTRGEITRGEKAILAQAIQSAVIWTRTQFPVMAARDVSAQEVRAAFRVAELVGDEDMNTPGNLRILKLADRSSAAPGEVITFTIRYDNIGDKPVTDVRIIDNLTPRLELVEGSATSDHAGRLDVDPNGEGSVVLTFVVDDPLPGKTGGVVTFKARVR